MENKYYTPTIEEFHVGFEYEFLKNHGSPNQVWEPRILDSITDGEDDPYLGYTFVSLQSYDNVFIRNAWRVKYLDQSDIESLGWYHDQTTKDGAYFYFGHLMSENHYCLNAPNARLSKGEDYTNIYIYSMNDNGNHFEGTIKNKSELIKLMQQLNIK